MSENERKINMDQLEFIDISAIPERKIPEPKKQKPKNSGGKITRLMAITAVILIAASLLAATMATILKTAAKSEDYIKRKNNLHVTFTSGAANFLFDNNVQVVEDNIYNNIFDIMIRSGNIRTNYMRSDIYDVSMDGNSAAYLSRSKTLYYITPSSMEEIDVNVINFALSDDGSRLAYLKNEGNSISLISYDTSSNKKEMIDSQLSGLWDYTYYTTTHITMSPDGNSLAYIKEISLEEGYVNLYNFTTYISINGGPPEELGKNIRCLAVSDNGEYVYYIQYVNNYKKYFYVKHRDKTSSIVLDEQQSCSVIFNIDYTEAIITSGRKIAACTGNGKILQIKYIGDNGLTMIVPPDTQHKLFNYGDIDVYTYGVKSLAEKYYSMSNKTLYLDKYYNFTSLISPAFEPILTADGKHIFFLDDNRHLQKYTLKNGGIKEKQELDHSNLIVSYNVSSEGSELYFMDRDNDLWYWAKGARPVKIADGIYDYCYNDKQGMVYFIIRDTYIQGGQLYYSRHGMKAERCEGISDVFYVYNAGSNILCNTNQTLRGDKYNVRYSRDGEKFHILGEVNMYINNIEDGDIIVPKPIN